MIMMDPLKACHLEGWWIGESLDNALKELLHYLSRPFSTICRCVDSLHDPVDGTEGRCLFIQEAFGGDDIHIIEVYEGITDDLADCTLHPELDTDTLCVGGQC